MSNGIPTALRVFLLSLVVGVGGAYAGFQAAVWLINRFGGRIDPMLVGALALVAAFGVGTASAVTAGVLAGKKQQG